MRQVPPLAPGPKAIKDGIDYFPPENAWLAASGGVADFDHCLLKKGPLGVGQIGIVYLAIHNFSPEKVDCSG
jgi:hypothetical protein